MKDFVFHNPTKIIFGRDKNKKIGEYLKKDKNSIKKILIVYGLGSIKRNGLYDVIINSLKSEGISYVELSGIKPNPVLTKVREGIEIIREHELDAILAVGGGSVIDTAKAISAGVFLDEDVWNLFLPGERIKIEKTLPVYVSLTFSATGSEANGGCVITNEETGEKFFYGSPLLYPKFSIIDPSIQFTVPDNQLKYGASDIIAHAMELYIDRYSSELIDEFIFSVIGTVMDSVTNLLANPEDYEYRAEYALSALFGLNGVLGIGGSGGDWTSHYIEHAISGLYPNIAHGAGLSVILPAYLKYIYPYFEEKLDKWSEHLWGVKGESGIEMLREWYYDIGLPIRLSDLGIEKSDYDKIIENTLKIGNLGAIVEIKESQLLKILKLAE